MTPDEIKSAITGWCEQGTTLQLVEDRSEPGADFVLGLRSDGHAATGTVALTVRLDEGSDHVTVTSTSTTGAAHGDIAQLLDSRPASVRGDTTVDGTLLTSLVYTDGFSKDSLFRALDEVAKTRTLLDGLTGAAMARPDVDGAGSVSEVEPEPEPSWAPRDEPAGVLDTPASALPAQSFDIPASALPAQTFETPASTLPTPSFSSPTPAASTYTPLSGQPAQPSQPVAPAFAPTHTVPPQGMQAWAAPDPNGAVVATLGGGLPIQITEVRGAWAHVLCSNGWTGWVDGRIIGVAR
jgi:Bacterial SH3 domain